MSYIATNSTLVTRDFYGHSLRSGFKMTMIVFRERGVFILRRFFVHNLINWIDDDEQGLVMTMRGLFYFGT